MITKFISKEERTQNLVLINEIANAVYNIPEDIQFVEEYIPDGNKVPGNDKVSKFSNFLIHLPNNLWAVYENDSQQNVVGFILISNKPHKNSTGFGIKKYFSQNGIMKRAWNEIKTHASIKFPLYAHTSKRNNAAISFLKSCGFIFIRDNNFLGEDSSEFEFPGL